MTIPAINSNACWSDYFMLVRLHDCQTSDNLYIDCVSPPYRRLCVNWIVIYMFRVWGICFGESSAHLICFLACSTVIQSSALYIWEPGVCHLVFSSFRSQRLRLVVSSYLIGWKKGLTWIFRHIQWRGEIIYSVALGSKLKISSQELMPSLWDRNEGALFRARVV